MTISATQSVAGPFTSGASFPFTFKVFSNAELVVVFTAVVGLESAYVEDVDYTLSRNADQQTNPGGTVTLIGGAIAAGEKITLARATILLQAVDLETQGAWQPEVIENALDRLTMIGQEAAALLARTVRVDISSGLDPQEILASLYAAIDASLLNANNSGISAAASEQSNVDAALEKTYAEEWATKAEDSTVSEAAGGDGTSEYSARHWSNKSAAFASASSTSAGQAATSASSAQATIDAVILSNVAFSSAFKYIGDDIVCDIDANANFIIRDINTANATRFTSNVGTGDFTATGNVTAYSDIKLKANIEIIPNALDKVMELSGYTFDRVDIKALGRQTGVIAQEVQRVLPEAVVVDIDRETREETLTVAYGQMVGLLIESIKELKHEIDELKASK